MPFGIVGSTQVIRTDDGVFPATRTLGGESSGTEYCVTAHHNHYSLIALNLLSLAVVKFRVAAGPLPPPVVARTLQL